MDSTEINSSSSSSPKVVPPPTTTTTQKTDEQLCATYLIDPSKLCSGGGDSLADPQTIRDAQQALLGYLDESGIVLLPGRDVWDDEQLGVPPIDESKLAPGDYFNRGLFDACLFVPYLDPKGRCTGGLWAARLNYQVGLSMHPVHCWDVMERLPYAHFSRNKLPDATYRMEKKVTVYQVDFLGDEVCLEPILDVREENFMKCYSSHVMDWLVPDPFATYRAAVVAYYKRMHTKRKAAAAAALAKAVPVPVADNVLPPT